MNQDLTPVDRLHQLSLEELNFLDWLVHGGKLRTGTDCAPALEKKGFIAKSADNEKGWESLLKFSIEDGSEQLLMELRFQRNEEKVRETINFERRHIND